MTIPQKQRSKQDDWINYLDKAYRFPDHARADELIDKAIGRINPYLAEASAPGWGWSGGKDSQGLRVIMEEAGVDECYLAISALEFPQFLAWATENMPDRLTVILNDQLNLDWLADHPDMIFPDSARAAKWFQSIQGRGRKKFIKDTDRDLIFLGRRKIDGNQTGTDGSYVQNGTAIVSPMHDWSHEDLLTVLGSRSMPLPPCYNWPRGFRVGTGSWPARQWVENRDFGFNEIWRIDPNVLIHASTKIEEVALWLKKSGNG
jgi:3'-phosphoadenosine 5'-phosphosulfate sulfotransferase (PAPS reductase)/FAD synthetase